MTSNAAPAAPIPPTSASSSVKGNKRRAPKGGKKKDAAENAPIFLRSKLPCVLVAHSSPKTSWARQRIVVLGGTLRPLLVRHMLVTMVCQTFTSNRVIIFSSAPRPS
jgi:hypothetical protein